MHHVLQVRRIVFPITRPFVFTPLIWFRVQYLDMPRYCQVISFVARYARYLAKYMFAVKPCLRYVAKSLVSHDCIF